MMCAVDLFRRFSAKVIWQKPMHTFFYLWRNSVGVINVDSTQSVHATGSKSGMVTQYVELSLNKV